MKWMRFRHGGREALGRLEGDQVVVCSGDLVGSPEPTGERLPVARGFR